MAKTIKFEEFATLWDLPKEERDLKLAQIDDFVRLWDLPKNEQDLELAESRTFEYVTGLESGSTEAIGRILRRRVDVAQLIPKIIATKLIGSEDIEGMMAFNAGYQDGLRQPISGLNQEGAHHE